MNKFFQFLSVFVVLFILVLRVSSVLGSTELPLMNGDIRLIEPLPMQTQAESSIVIDTGNYTGPLIILVDGVDVSAMVKHEGAQWRYQPSDPFAAGKHHLEVLATGMASSARADWVLSVGEELLEGEKETLYSKSSFSLTGNQVFGKKTQDQDIAANGNLALNVGAKSGETEVSFESNMGYSNTSPTNELTPFGLLFQVKHDKNRLAFGDVVFSGTPLTALPLSRRGVSAEMQGENAGLQVIQASSRTVTGWNSGLSSENQIRGAGVTYHLAGQNDQPLRIAAVALDGEILSDSSPNVASIAAPSRGSVGGVLGSGRYAGIGYNAEIAASANNPNTLSNEGTRRDLAGRLQLDKTVGGVNLRANYQRTGARFASIANSGATYDREQYALSGGAGFGTSFLSASLSRSRDNLDNDPARPVVYNNNTGLTYSLIQQNWPALSLSYLYGRVKSQSEPAGDPETDILNQSGTAALSYGGEGWSSNLVLSDSWIADPLNGDANTRNAALSGSLKWLDKLSLEPTFSYSNIDYNGMFQKTTAGTLTLNWHIIAPLSLAGQMTWTKNDISDNLADNVERTAILRMVWDISPRLKSLFPRQHSGLTLSYSGDHYADHLDSSQNRWDQTVMLGIQVFSPLEGEVHF
ncbi:MAG: hypothetical protein HY036_09185 [Nitrospirae bacterium]|nr:hypothetical protein [Nitrospirota bacterium]MBI3352738.1 hypothetical protein [Nitrospirota bacterium]